MQLRDYQQRAVDEFMAHDDRVCLAAPTGSGKTVMGVACAVRYGGQVGWIAHRRELISQARDRLEAAGVQIAFCETVQTLAARIKTEKLVCDLLVEDECHHLPGVNEWSQVVHAIEFKRALGLTATPARSDGKGLSAMFDRIVVAAHYSELLRDGYICPCKVFGGPDVVGALSADPVTAWRKHGAKRLTIGFAPSLETAWRWTEQFRWAGVRSEYISGDTPTEQRDDILARFARGEITVLWNVYVLTEGLDIPQISCVILARPFDRQCLSCGAVCKSWVGKCPFCGHETPRASLPVKVYDEQLEEVFDGRETAEHEKDAALKRMRAQQIAGGHSLKWLRDTYKAQFGIYPIIRDATEEEKARAWESLKSAAIKSNRKLGWAAAIFKSQFGAPPAGWSWSQS